MFSSVESIGMIRVISIKISYVLLIIAVISNMFEYSKKDFILIGIFIIIGFISYKFSVSNNIILILLFLVAFKNIKFDKIVEYDFYLKIFFILIVYVLYKIGLTENYFMYRPNGSIRSSMGFLHPNTFGTYVFLIVCEFMYLNYRKGKNKKIFNFIFLGIAFLLVYFISDSRTAQIGIVLLALVNIISDRKIFVKTMSNKRINIFFSLLFLIFTLISFVLGALYNRDNKVVQKINSSVSNRIQMISYFTQRYKINLQGNYVRFVGTKIAKEKHLKSKVLDNVYTKMILQYGILVYLIFLMLYIKSIMRAYKEKNYIFIIIMNVYCIYASMENVFLMLPYCVFLLYFSKSLEIEEYKSYYEFLKTKIKKLKK